MWPANKKHTYVGTYVDWKQRVVKGDIFLLYFVHLKKEENWLGNIALKDTQMTPSLFYYIYILENLDSVACVALLECNHVLHELLPSVAYRLSEKLCLDLALKSKFFAYFTAQVKAGWFKHPSCTVYNVCVHKISKV